MNRRANQISRLLVTSAALLLTACAARAPVSQVAATPIAAHRATSWFDPQSLQLAALLPAVPDAAATRGELDEMLRHQAQRSADDCNKAAQDVAKDLSRFTAVLATDLSDKDPRLQATARLLGEMRNLQESVTSRLKDQTNRPRPYQREAAIVPCIQRPTSFAYPSGHAAFGMAAALLLADMVPERRAELLARGREYGMQRVIGGVHFPSDVAAGRTSGILIAAFLLASPSYRQDAALARTGLRAALGLPAAK